MKIKKEEKILMNNIESGNWVSVKELDTYKRHLIEVAKNTMIKDRRMNIRIAKRDLDKLKARALEEGMPYQTLVSSILHKYLTGKLKESKIE